MPADGISSTSLYFNAAQSASLQQSKETEKKSKTAGTQKKSFANALKKSQEEFELTQDGLPAEIAGMSAEDAVIFLKDQVDVAGDMLQENPNLERIGAYREKLGNLMRFISRNNYDVPVIDRKFHGRPLLDKKTGKQAKYVQIRVINEKLEQLTSDLLYNHSKNINLLARVEEINGLIVDLLAS